MERTFSQWNLDNSGVIDTEIHDFNESFSQEHAFKGA